MNAAAKTVETLTTSGTALTLTVKERAVLALGLTDKEVSLKALAAETADIVAITNADGRQQVYSARIKLKNERLTITRVGKEARDDATAFSKAVIAEEARLVKIIEPEEERLQKLQDEHDAKIERERQELIEAELERTRLIRESITEMREAVTASVGRTAEAILERIGEIERTNIDETFGEYRDEAADAKVASLARLRDIHTAAVAHAAEQVRIAAERKELEQRRAQDVERERVAAQERARTDKQLYDITAIAEQPTLAVTGMSGQRRVRKGGTRECIVTTLEETERWPVDAEVFGNLTVVAQATKAASIAAIKSALADFDRRIEDEARAKADRDREATEKRRQDEEAQRIADQQRETDRLERERLDREAREAERVRQEQLAEQNRLAEQQRQADAAAAAKRAEQDRIELARGNPPSAHDIMLLIATEHMVPMTVALEWIRDIDWSEVS